MRGANFDAATIIRFLKPPLKVQNPFDPQTAAGAEVVPHRESDGRVGYFHRGLSLRLTSASDEGGDCGQPDLARNPSA
jgi:hypothetical protein